MDSSMKRVLIAAIALALAACGRGEAPPSASATTAAPVPAAGSATPTAVESFLMTQGVKIPVAFDSVSGFKAIVADNGAERKLMYVSPDGQSLFVGTVYDVTGNNVTSSDMNRAAIRPSPAGFSVDSVTPEQRTALWERAGKLDFIEEGGGDKTVYAIIDPTCPYCHQLYRQTREAVAAGKIRIRWLPVAILSDDSKGLGAAVYAAKDRKDGLADLMTGQLSAATVTRPTAQILAHNLLLLRDTGHTGVPFVLYEGPDGVVLEDDPLEDSIFARIFQG